MDKKKKNKKTAIIAAVIVLLGIGVWFLLSGGKGDGNGTITGGSDSATPSGEIQTKGEVCWLPLPSYPGMIKFMEQIDEKRGDVLAMYNIEGADKTEEIKDFYKARALSDGWGIDSEMFVESAWTLSFSKGTDYSLQISVGCSNGSTQLSLACSGPSSEEKENPYDSAKEVKSSTDLNTAFHNDFQSVLDSVFGGAKLTSASSDKYSECLSYIVKRQIVEEDTQSVRDALEESGYKTTSTNAEFDKYRYDFSKEVLGEEYDDINLTIWLAEEGNRQQKISIDIYK